MSTPNVARGLWALAVVVVLAAVPLMIATGWRDFGVDPESPAQRGIELVTAITLASAGMIILTRVPRNVIGWLFLAVGLGTALTELATGYAATCAPTASCQVVALVAVDAIWFPTISIGLGGLFLMFPDGGLPRGWRAWLWWSLVATGLMGTATAFAQSEVYLLANADNPLAGVVDATVAKAITDVAGVATVLLTMVAVIDFVVRARRASGVTRMQNRWLAFSGLLLVLGAVTSIVGEEIGVDFGWVWSLATLSIPIAVAFAITRNHLYDIDRIISRTVSYSMVVAVLGALFAVVVVGVPNWVPGLDDSPLLVAVGTLGVAALFNPLRKRVRAWVDRRFNRSRYDAEVLMGEFTESLRDRVEAEEVIEGWVGVVAQTMQPETVGVWVRA